MKGKGLSLVTRIARVKAHPLLAVLAVIVAAGVVAGGAMASASTTSKGAPWPAAKSKIFLYVDTEAAATEGVYGDCEQANLFEHGQSVLFRAAAQVAKTGVTLQPSQITTFEVLVPGEKPIPLVYGVHNFGMDKGVKTPPDYWTGVWKVPAKYPLGIVRFKVKVVTKTKPAVTATWAQIPIEASSLTIVPSDK